MKVLLLFEIEVSEIREAVDGHLGIAVGKAMVRAKEAIRSEGFDSVRLLRADKIDELERGHGQH